MWGSGGVEPDPSRRGYEVEGDEAVYKEALLG